MSAPGRSAAASALPPQAASSRRRASGQPLPAATSLWTAVLCLLQHSPLLLSASRAGHPASPAAPKCELSRAQASAGDTNIEPRQDNVNNSQALVLLVSVRHRRSPKVYLLFEGRHLFDPPLLDAPSTLSVGNAPLDFPSGGMLPVSDRNAERMHRAYTRVQPQCF